MVILEPGQDGKLAVIVMVAVSVHASVVLERATARALSVEGSRAKESVLRWQTAPGMQTSHKRLKHEQEVTHFTFRHDRIEWKRVSTSK